jgi:RHS repeat-associated protein
MATENKGFGALFAEKKNSLDHIQKGMASILPSFPGMPAAKYFDLGIGIDFHDSVFPPSPLLPVPHIGMIFDIMGAIMAAIASVVPPPPPPPEVEEGEEPPPQPFSLAATAQMLVHALSPSVKVHNQWIANAGTTIFHLPAFIAHLPFPIVKPKAASEMWMGSSTVLADGGPFSTQFHPALSCNLVGLPSPPRLNKKSSAFALMAPTSVLLIMTSAGKPVLVGGPPTIDLFQLMFKLGLKGLSKAAGAALQKVINKIESKFPKLAAILQNFKCKHFGEPVDAASGRVFSSNVDFELPGPIPLVWERTYYSDAAVPGPLGYNWHHNYNMSVYNLQNGYFSIRLWDGRETVMPALAAGGSYYNRKELLWWYRDNSGYYLQDTVGQIYRFTSKASPDGHYPLSEISNVAGFTIQFRYNSNGYLQQIIDSSNRLLQVTTDEEGRIEKIHTRNGAEIIDLVRYAYDEDGNLSSTTNALDVSKYFFYRKHLLVQLTNQSGLSFYWEYDGAGEDARCIHTWGDNGVLEYHVRYEEGKTTATNSLGHTTEYFYDERNLIYKIIDGNGGVSLQQYNGYEELEVVVDPAGNANKYSYDEYGRIEKQVNGNGEATIFFYDEAQRLIGVKSPGGRRLQWSYNEEGLLEKKKYVNGNTLKYEYSGPHLTRLVHNSGRMFEMDYDAQHNLKRLTLPGGGQQYWEYDELGRLIKETLPTGYWYEYAYDAAGNMTFMKESDGAIHTFSYDAANNMITATDGYRKVDFTYGPLGILTGRRQHGVNVRFNYDTEQQLRAIVNEGGEVYRFEPDANGNIIEEWGFDGIHHRYERDGAGRIKKVIRPGDRWSMYDHDSNGHVVREAYHDGSVAAYGYNKDGMLTGAFNEEGEITIEYDAFGRVTKETQGAHSVTREYDEVSENSFVGSDLGAAITLQHGITGAVEKMQASAGASGNWEALWERNNRGLELQRMLSGGVNVQTQRDRLGRVTRQSIGVQQVEQRRTRYEWGRANQLRRMVNELAGTQVQFDYDEFNNLESATYTQAEGGASETIYRVPDKLGNLFDTPTRKDRVYGKGGRLLECPDYYYHYDVEGNLVFKEFKHNHHAGAEDKQGLLKAVKITAKGSRTGWIYDWNGNGSLHQVITPAGAAIVFSYDPLGRRIAKVNKRKERVTRWLWNGNVPLHEWQYNGDYPPHWRAVEDGALHPEEEPVENLITWVFEEGSFVPCAKLMEDTSFSIISDHLGTPVYAFDTAGNKVWERELDCYGKVHKLYGDKTFCNYLYQGQYMDEETGLAYNRFRYYSPEEGVYLSQDPFGLHGGLRLYGYVKDPNTYVDSCGLMPWEPGTPKPKGWRLPKNGTWSGDPGHSNFIPSDPAGLGLPEGTEIPFVKGTPDFSSVQVREPIQVAGLTGDQSVDKALTASALSEKYPLEFKNQAAALEWMKVNEVTPHHFQGDMMQFPPSLAHGKIRHSGTAHEMRAAGETHH